MSIEVAGNEKVNMTFMKCGMRALLVDRYIINNQFTFEPGMLRMLDDVAEYACKEENTPLQVYITGNANITGTIVFRILQDPASLSDLSDSVLFPLIHFVIFLMVVLAGFTVIPLIYWVENRKSKEKEYEKNFASSWSL